MNIRKLEQKDILKLREIHAKHHNYPFPDLNNPLYALQHVVTEGNKIIGAGIIRLTSEGLFILDKDMSPFVRAKAIKLLNENIKLLWNFGLEECHIFTENDDSFVNIMRTLGFEDCTGYPMVKQK